MWSAIHPASVLIAYNLFAPLTLHNFAAAWAAAPLGRYMANTVMLVSMVLVAQFVLCTPAAFAFARLRFPGRDILFAVVLIQLMVSPDILMVENYQTIGASRTGRHAAWHRAAVPRLRLRHLPAAPDFPHRTAGVGRRRAA